MPQISRKTQTRRYVIQMDGAGRFLLKDKQTGKILPLRGYGALRDELAARKGLDLTKPIYEQVMSERKVKR